MSLFKQANANVSTTLRNASCSGGWLKQFNHVLFSVLTVVIFLAILLVVLKSTVTANIPPKRDGLKCILKKCELTCYGKAPENDPESFDNYLMGVDSTCKTRGMSLILEKPLFANQTFNGKIWLDLSYKISSLKIVGGNLEFIEPFSFSSVLFINLRFLIFKDIAFYKIVQPRFRSLEGLDSIIINNLQFDIDQHTINPLRDTVTTLKVNNCGSWNPKHFTGEGIFYNLKEIDFSFNNFQTILDNTSFSDLNKCEKLSLRSSKIKVIRFGTFDSLINIKIIDLRNNLLTSLPFNLFDSFIARSVINIYLYNNPWHCDCHTFHMLNLMYHKSRTYIDPICASPESYRFKPIRDLASVCNISTSLSKIEIKQKRLKKAIENLDCKTETSFPASSQCVPTSSTVTSWNVTLKPNMSSTSNNIEIIDIGSNNYISVLAVSAIRNRIDEYYEVYWYKSSCAEIMYCFEDLRNLKLILLYNVEYNTTYTFCFVTNRDNALLQSSCISKIVRNSERAYTESSYNKVLTWIGKCSMIIASLLIGATLVYLLVRKYPVLLKGSDRVLVVQHKVADVLVLPPNLPLRAIKGNETLKSNESNTPSYISALQPTESQLAMWRLHYLLDNNDTNPHSRNSNTKVFEFND